MTNNTTAALTDEQIVEIYDDFYTQEDERESSHILPFARAIERALLTSPRAAVPSHEELIKHMVDRFLGWPLPTDFNPDAGISFKPTFNDHLPDGPMRHTPSGTNLLNGAQAEEMVRYMLDAAPAAPVAEAEPIPMLLFCPRCGTQHIDAPEDAECDGEVVHSAGWSNPPHRSHLCHACGIVWRPADVATVGVEAIETRGKADTWTKETPWIGHNRPVAQAVAADGAQPVPWRSVVQAIYAVGKEAARRGEMYPQTADEQDMDRKAEQRVAEEIEWYATKGGAIAEQLPGWPSYEITRAAVSPATAALPIKIPHVHMRPEDEEIGRQYYALGFVDGNRSITDAPQLAQVASLMTATADERAAQLDFSLLARLSARIMGCPINPALSKFARAIEANVRASQGAAPARIEALRKGLFNARDALQAIHENRVTSNATVRRWIEDANRVLNGEQAAAPAEARPTSFHFHRFVNGQEMAEDVLIERATTIEAAIREAVRHCPKQAMTVLVHAPAWVGTLHGGALAKRAAPAEAREPDAFDRWEQECERDHGPYPEDAPMAQRLRWWIPKSARHGKTSFEYDISDAADMLDSLVRADAGDSVASIENPLTPYGLLVRALRIVAGTTLMEMATGMGVSPAFLSSLEFGRRPVTYDNAAFASGFFSDNGVVDTLPALAHAVGLSQGAQGGKGGEA
ncbi:helix-turn-helix domain-containing protein [Burkholderia gladioli]|uniref:helix-turn-helix domain-containing protein n=1 Tax=Burkholderia gladioli TaxID=28095 RepID=UPI001C5E3EB2|nr:helix-turn-helix transcriptional regulator [Burkholderia gladioli]MBW5285980.1 helix-turn-helix transcriptional regulator [Burkholderia gladioli]